MCGEKLLDLLGSGLLYGSPPRVRGKGSRSGFLYAASRITPACAGKSEEAKIVRQVFRDHPRVCGEKQAPLFIVFLGPGSPPRVRGKVLMQPGFADALGITPACAGKSRESDRPDAFT